MAKTTKTSKRLKKSAIIQQITQFFNQYPKESFNYKQVSAGIGASGDIERAMVLDILMAMTEEGTLKESGRFAFKLGRCSSIAVGIFERRSNGKNRFIPEEGSGMTESVNVAERRSLNAMNGDKVKIELFARRAGRLMEGEVIEIIERAKQRFVGSMEIARGYAFVCIDSKLLANDIFVPKGALKGAKDGDKVLVEVTDWPNRAKNPIGKVIDVLGTAGENNAEMHAILAEYGLPYSYPEELEKLANELPDTISKEEIARRADYRKVTTMTIDPRDAKDFDDAISLQRLKNGNWEVGVHIADVTHYVQPGDKIDQEGEQRATSIYLVDRTIPMLPEHISNFLCSLRPNEDKLAYSAIFEMTDQAQIVRSEVKRTVIHSDRRFTYEEAQAIIEGAEGDYKEEILTLDRLAKLLRAERFSSGAVKFEREEVRFEIDETGRPLSVYTKESKESNHLVEEMMLLANKTVAELIGKPKRGAKAKTFVYRIHDTPDTERLNDFATFARRFGYKLRTEGTNKQTSQSINKLMDAIHGKPEENLLSTIAIRSMAKAVYTTDNIGHYGLAFDHYTHFTSPIRRFPDMMVHRLLTHYLEGGKSVSQPAIEKQCEHCGAMEQLAANAERASIKFKQCEYMKERLGDEFNGIISGVTEWGLYVEEIETKCEGLIPVRELDDDYYEFDEKNYCLRGRSNGRKYRLGDPIRFTVANVNLYRKQMDYNVVQPDTKKK